MAEKTQDHWRTFARAAGQGGSALYAQLASAIAEDREIREFASRTRAGQPPANMLFGAVQFLLFNGAQGELRRYWPSVGGRAAGDPYPAFKEFVRAFEKEILGLIATRVTNTNEAGRCVQLFPAFCAVAAEAKRPLHMIEIGPSAGLNLYWDEYRYRYARADGSVVAGGAAKSPVVLTADMRGAREPLVTGLVPEVASRIGIELNPVNLADEDDKVWLRALIWPERADRFARFDGAVAMALARGRPPIVAGDAVEKLPAVLARLPPGEPVCIYHTNAVYQIPAPRAALLGQAMAEASLSRPVFRVASEWDGEEQPLDLTTYRGGRAESLRLARGDPHGGWIEWLA